MPEERNCQLQAPRGPDKKKKKKKRRRREHVTSSTLPENTDKPQGVSPPPETLPWSLLPPVSSDQSRVRLPKLRATSLKESGRLTNGGRWSKKHSTDAATNKSSGGGSPFQGHVHDLNAQARESLRWEGVLEDPEAEEKRLEVYRSNRRQRYISQREALLKGRQCADVS